MPMRWQIDAKSFVLFMLKWNRESSCGMCLMAGMLSPRVILARKWLTLYLFDAFVSHTWRSQAVYTSPRVSR